VGKQALKQTEKSTYRKKTRELLFRLVFQMSSTGDFSDAAKDAFLEDTTLYIGDVREDVPLGCIFDESEGEAPDMPYLNWAFACIRDHLAEIDRTIAEASKKWSLERMGTVDLSILRVALAEFLCMDSIAASISINEAVLMAKKYGTEKSPVFVNGILGAVARERQEASL